VQDSGPVSGRLCARCGLTVAAGYARCPRCQADLPVARARPPTGPPPRGAGGTVVEPLLDRRRVGILAGGGIALAVIVLWLVFRGDDAPAKPGAGTDDPVAAAGDDDPGPAGPGPGGGDDSADVGPSPPPVPVGPTPPAGGSRNGAVGGLSRALREARLWATVSGDGDGVLIESSFCDDTGLASIVDGATAELRQVGFTSVRCRAPHGGVVFDRAL
jgi:hypothetical protein